VLLAAGGRLLDLANPESRNIVTIEGAIELNEKSTAHKCEKLGPTPRGGG